MISRSLIEAPKRICASLSSMGVAILFSFFFFSCSFPFSLSFFPPLSLEDAERRVCDLVAVESRTSARAPLIVTIIFKS